MTYPYICVHCRYTTDFEITLNDDIPKTQQCPKCNKSMKRDLLAQLKSQNVKIPQHMMATSRFPTRINYTKDAAIEHADT